VITATPVPDAGGLVPTLAGEAGRGPVVISVLLAVQRVGSEAMAAADGADTGVRRVGGMAGPCADGGGSGAGGLVRGASVLAPATALGGRGAGTTTGSGAGAGAGTDGPATGAASLLASASNG
jgi:hypothetical protein